MTVFIGTGHDNKSVDVQTEEQELTVSLNDGRKFQVQLYEKILPDKTLVNFKGPRCQVTMKKEDSKIHWPSLEVNCIILSFI